MVTHIHAKAGYLFIKDQGTGKVYHVSWASVTHVNGKSAAEVAGNGGTENYWQSTAGKAILEAQSKPKQTEGPAATTLKEHGWKPTKTFENGAATFTHPKMGNTFHVAADGTLTNLDSGTKVKPDEAADYLRGFHPNSEKQAEGAAKQKAPKGVSTDWKDYAKGDTVVSHYGEEWKVDHAVGKGVYATSKEGEGPKTLIKWNEIAKHTPKKEGPGSRGSTKWYYDSHGEVRYGEPTPQG